MRSIDQRGYVEIDGCQLEYIWFRENAVPSERTVVLLHEGLGCVQGWGEFPQLLAEATGFPILAYSRAGYGGSGSGSISRPLDWMHHEALVVLPALLGKLDIKSYVLVGHSDGASISIIYAGGQMQGCLDGLVLMAPHVFLEEVSLTGVDQARSLYLTDDLRDKLVRYHGDQVDGAFWGWNKFWRRPEIRDWNIEDSLQHIEVPVLIIQGENDEYGSIAQLDSIESQVPTAVERHFLKHVGHSPHRDQPKFLLDTIGRFIGRIWRDT